MIGNFDQTISYTFEVLFLIGALPDQALCQRFVFSREPGADYWRNEAFSTESSED